MGRNKFRKGKKKHNQKVEQRNLSLKAKENKKHELFMEQLKIAHEEALKQEDVQVINVDELGGDIGDIGDIEMIDEINESDIGDIEVIEDKN